MSGIYTDPKEIIMKLKLKCTDQLENESLSEETRELILMIFALTVAFEMQGRPYAH